MSQKKRSKRWVEFAAAVSLNSHAPSSCKVNKEEKKRVITSSRVVLCSSIKEERRIIEFSEEHKFMCAMEAAKRNYVFWRMRCWKRNDQKLSSSFFRLDSRCFVIAVERNQEKKIRANCSRSCRQASEGDENCFHRRRRLSSVQSWRNKIK